MSCVWFKKCAIFGSIFVRTHLCNVNCRGQHLREQFRVLVNCSVYPFSPSPLSSGVYSTTRLFKGLLTTPHTIVAPIMS